MNQEKRKRIIELNNNIVPNTYKHGKDLTGNFIVSAAKSLKKGTEKQDKKIFFLHNKKRFGFVDGLRAGSTSPISYKICKDKFVTEKWLKKMSISTLHSMIFDHQQIREAIEFVRNNPNKNFVVKPISLSSGRGIIFNVNHSNIEDALNKSFNIQKQNNIEMPSFIIQEFIDGFDVRICITEGTFACALWRIPAHVVGNDNDTIEELIEAKNSHRESSVYFSNFVYQITEQMKEYIESQGFKLDSIPKKDELIFLSFLGNLQAGAESMDVTDLVSSELIDLAIKTVASIPGLHSAGVDILAESLNSELGFVIEVNTNANNKVHYLPYYGEVKKPYVNIIQNMLVKHKIQSGIRLEIDEVKLYREIAKFNLYRDEYQVRTAKLLIDN